uniref:Uncharacterized protein n=1 Tax=Setaria viridis TaxID=4556 RepID=A0A4U6T2N8_SETVI|nr:hypothetical protein SEVIR_9G069400v2 [Setaria viridis]
MEITLDLLLDIVARSHDAATIVRCAAASRHLRRGILEPSSPPDPVVAASYEIVDHHDRSCRDNDVIETARRLRLDSSLLGSHSFMSSRFELLVLWRWLPPRAPQTGIPPRTATCASATPSPATSPPFLLPAAYPSVATTAATSTGAPSSPSTSPTPASCCWSWT